MAERSSGIEVAIRLMRLALPLLSRAGEAAVVARLQGAIEAAEDALGDDPGRRTVPRISPTRESGGLGEEGE